ncbi:S-adenosyl-L-methionine-dependent methyltransferase [Mycena maculata]|uniref:DNA (cytosine-5-)-methyltransferase n=1 Tax=Mycena maculata TaxID=230809 RepID=A0AAD7NVH1_9AGAR|nr:S-adenosyl-L-methionine-dependent methyltransferase [Mycena maculata]
MAPPPRRPTAWEISFPEEAAAELAALQISATPNSTSLKRKAEDNNDMVPRVVKRSHRLGVTHYEPPSNYTIETAHYRAPGEDIGPGSGKPIRILQNFCVFDQSHKSAMVTLDVVEIDENIHRGKYSAAGVVLLPDEDDEDYGQEDGADTAESNGDHVLIEIIGISPFDYFAANAPIFLETKWALYELRGPSTLYKPYLVAYSTPRRVARSVVRAASHPEEDLAQYRSRTRSKDADLAEAIPYIREAIQDDLSGKLQRSPLIEELLCSLPHDHAPARLPRPRSRRQFPTPTFLGNPDLALLKPENQSPTHVTPLIYKLATGYFDEGLQVVGPEPMSPTKAEVEMERAKALQFLKDCVEKVRSPIKRVALSTDARRPGWSGGYMKEAKVGDDVYQTGDFVLIRKGHSPGLDLPAPLLINIPNDAKLTDYFWFARILYFDLAKQRVHLEWLEHGSQIILGEMGHPRELFLDMLCESFSVEFIAAKISVTYAMEPLRKADQFFFRSIYNENDASFTSVNEQEMRRISDRPPPYNCPSCARSQASMLNGDCALVREDSRDVSGICYRGRKYHLSEYFLYQNARDGPAHIGHLNNIQVGPRRAAKLIMFRKVGRVSIDLKGIPEDVENNDYPERHVFLTAEVDTIPVDHLVCPVHVYAWDFFKSPEELKAWVDYSPYNFYVSFRVPSTTTELRAQSWARREQVFSYSHIVCEFLCCRSEMYRADLEEDTFQVEQDSQGYQCLDLFGGTGAFSRGVSEGSRGCVKPTHLIEITPSAARTAKKNSNADMVTYCQDANVVLRYFIKSAANHDVETPKQLFDNKTLVPPPIKPGKMRAIFAGLPCQSHSRLNMYRKAEDKKSNLILTAASYVDFFRPDFFFLEVRFMTVLLWLLIELMLSQNVPGFLKYNLLAQQASQHRVEGGIEMGGLKLLLRALLEMKYQVRFFLLQAGNYGAPQNRIRFFLVAARHGLPIPNVPQPTHDFPVVNHLRIRFPFHKEPIEPIRTTRGTMAHPSVSIADAIGDLPQFDWEHPDPKNAAPALRRLLNQRKQAGIPVLKCDVDRAHCGYEGAGEYNDEPKTSYQRQAREHQTKNIQHFTRCLLPQTVERVVTIPLEPDADFRSLPDHLGEWQFTSPLSAVGRNRYRGAVYGRLDDNGYVPTIVTNVHPTAKQSKVLHPDCLRMVTVRELARCQGFPDWFVFVSIDANVVTIHRQIGNAVPWQVSRALGRELRTALFDDWKRKLFENEMDTDEDD